MGAYFRWQNPSGETAGRWFKSDRACHFNQGSTAIRKTPPFTREATVAGLILSTAAVTSLRGTQTEVIDVTIDTYELNRYGYTEKLPAISDEIYNANIILVTVGTNGYHGGDSGHGSKSFFEIANQGGTDISVLVNGKEIDDVQSVAITVGGDAELRTLIQALEFGAKALRALSESSSLQNLAFGVDDTDQKD